MKAVTVCRNAALQCFVLRKSSPHRIAWCSRVYSTEDFSSDLFDSLSKEHERERRLRSMPSAVDFENMIMGILPEDSRRHQPAVDGVRKYFLSHKINRYIPCEKVRITSVEVDGKLTDGYIDRNAAYTIDDAIALAEKVKSDLVMMAEKDGVAYCKIKDEKKRALEHISHLLKRTDEVEKQSRYDAHKQKSAKVEEIIFRDIIDSQAIDWKSKYAVQALKRFRPVKLICEKFSSPRGVVDKLSEFLSKIRGWAEADNVVYNAMQVSVSDRSFTVIIQPSSNAKEIKQPGKSDWDKVMQRFKTAFDKSGRDDVGTWHQRQKLKARASGFRMYRTDKYGRKIETKGFDDLKQSSSVEEFAQARVAAQERIDSLFSKSR